MDVLWGIILLIVMYIVIPVAIIGGTLAALGGGNRVLRRGRGRGDAAGERGATNGR